MQQALCQGAKDIEARGGGIVNTDIRLSTGFWQHPKTRKLSRRLGLEGVRSLQILWAWTAQNRPDGELSGMDWEDIELAADWQGEERVFFDYCLGVWIDENPCGDGYVVHNWKEHNSWAAEADNRSDASRLSRMAKTYPNEYQTLVQAGVKGISSTDYAALKNVKERSDVIQRLVNEASANINNDRSTTVERPSTIATSPAPAPAPSPTPMVINNTSPDGDVVGGEPPTSARQPEILQPEEHGDSGKAAVPDCPHEQIIAAYHEILPELARVKVWTGARESNLRSRWRERWQAKKYRTQPEGLAYWQRLFRHVHDNCPWLMGQVPDREGKCFKADLAWMVLPSNFAKIIEGKYDRRECAA